jgi:predicted ribosome quality control (RQC) complex YloA/Tae2 family protein|tara:strand:- start:1168 stop:1488 length:321 start_codon:yes stop_codon:yes gene_type:complete
MKELEFNETNIVLGENAQDNWDIIDFNSNHIWLHLDSFPSCHVIIQHESPDNEVIMYAAELCKSKTKYKNLKNVKVCYTKCSNLVKGTDIGSVIYKSKRQVKRVMV